MRSNHLTAHARRHDPKASRAFKCSFNNCLKGFSTPQHLQRHEALHTAPTPYRVKRDKYDLTIMYVLSLVIALYLHIYRSIV